MVRLRFNRLPTASAPTSVMPVLIRLHGQSVCVGKRNHNKFKLNQEKRGRKTKKTEGKGSRERERKHHVSEFK